MRKGLTRKGKSVFIRSKTNSFSFFSMENTSFKGGIFYRYKREGKDLAQGESR